MVALLGIYLVAYLVVVTAAKMVATKVFVMAGQTAEWMAAGLGDQQAVLLVGMLVGQKDVWMVKKMVVR